MIPKNYTYIEGRPKKYLYSNFYKIRDNHVIEIQNYTVTFSNGDLYWLVSYEGICLKGDLEESVIFYIKQFLRSFK